jgi:hypothetical protein
MTYLHLETKQFPKLSAYLGLKMEAVCSSETSVYNHKSIRRQRPEDKH